MIEQATWARDDDLWFTTELRYLTTVRDTAVNRDALQASSWRELFNNIINLLCELTGRSEDKRLSALLF
jgi:hypothetical protein